MNKTSFSILTRIGKCIYDYGLDVLNYDDLHSFLCLLYQHWLRNKRSNFITLWIIWWFIRSSVILALRNLKVFVKKINKSKKAKELDRIENDILITYLL